MFWFVLMYDILHAIGYASMIIVLQLMNYGATIISIKVPSKNGLTDVVLGFDEIDGYLRYVQTCKNVK